MTWGDETALKIMKKRIVGLPPTMTWGEETALKIMKKIIWKRSGKDQVNSHVVH